MRLHTTNTAGRRQSNLFADAPADIQESIENAAVVRAKANGGILGRTGSSLVVRMERDKLIDQHFGIPTMDKWLANRKLN
jgi:hypothetical protein